MEGSGRRIGADADCADSPPSVHLVAELSKRCLTVRIFALADLSRQGNRRSQGSGRGRPVGALGNRIAQRQGFLSLSQVALRAGFACSDGCHACATERRWTRSGCGDGSDCEIHGGRWLQRHHRLPRVPHLQGWFNQEKLMLSIFWFNRGVFLAWFNPCEAALRIRSRSRSR